MGLLWVAFVVIPQVCMTLIGRTSSCHHNQSAVCPSSTSTGIDLTGGTRLFRFLSGGQDWFDCAALFLRRGITVAAGARL